MNDNLIIQHLYSLSPNLFFLNLNLVIICRRLDCHSFSDLVNLLAAGHLEACNSFQKNRLKNKQWNCYYRAHVSSLMKGSVIRAYMYPIKNCLLYINYLYYSSSCSQGHFSTCKFIGKILV